jgi:hypothetical protein
VGFFAADQLRALWAAEAATARWLLFLQALAAWRSPSGRGGEPRARRPATGPRAPGPWRHGACAARAAIAVLGAGRVRDRAGLRRLGELLASATLASAYVALRAARAACAWPTASWPGCCGCRRGRGPDQRAAPPGR